VLILNVEIADNMWKMIGIGIGKCWQWWAMVENSWLSSATVKMVGSGWQWLAMIESWDWEVLAMMGNGWEWLKKFGNC
jgi:hypothetical protein